MPVDGTEAALYLRESIESGLAVRTYVRNSINEQLNYCSVELAGCPRSDHSANGTAKSSGSNE